MAKAGRRQRGARVALLTLSLINLLNYADRYIPSAVKSLIQADLSLDDFQSSLPTTGMVVVYMIFATIFGMLSDKQYIDRRWILWGAIIFWSLATSLAGFATNLVQLICIRSLVGVGEAAYTTIAPPMLLDFYPYHERSLIIGFFYLAIPVGGALGYAIGSGLGQAFGWRVAFYAIGVPGLGAAMMVLRLKNPPMGINDLPADPTDNQPRSSDIRVIDTSASPLTDQHLLPLPQDQPPSPTATTTTATAPAPAPVAAGWLPWLSHELSVGGAELWEILQIEAFVFCTLGQAASAFASGGLAEWLPVYLIRYAGADVSSAGLLVGAATIVGGLGGTILGAKVSEHYLRKVKSAYFLIPALFTLPAALLFVITLNAPHLGTGGIGVLVIAVQIFFWTGIAPISTVSMNVVPPRLRARSCGVLILVQHVLGDLISPPLIGAISDSLQSLQTALQMVWIAVLVSGAWFFAGYYFLRPLDVDLCQGDSTVVPGDTDIITDTAARRAALAGDGFDAAADAGAAAVAKARREENTTFTAEAEADSEAARGEGSERSRPSLSTLGSHGGGNGKPVPVPVPVPAPVPPAGGSGRVASNKATFRAIFFGHEDEDSDEEEVEKEHTRPTAPV